MGCLSEWISVISKDSEGQLVCKAVYIQVHTEISTWERLVIVGLFTEDNIIYILTNKLLISESILMTVTTWVIFMLCI
jgi:hypothetical protein